MNKIFNKLKAFFSNKWSPAVFDEKIGIWVVKPNHSNIPYLKAENANGRHILIRPDLTVIKYYLLIDDISFELIQHHHKLANGNWKPGRLVVETSPNNYQVWIKSNRTLTLDEKRYWLKKLCSDPGADPKNRWGRCPGFRNRKKKYCNINGEYPLSKLIWIDWKNTANIPYSNLLFNNNENDTFSHQPFGVVCHKNIYRSDYDKNDESLTDFVYALALMRRGYQDFAIKQRIITERINWDNHYGQKKQDFYLNTTIKKARTIFVQSAS
jgi:hypothetical protein